MAEGTGMQTCTNSGCGVKFIPDKNTGTPCLFHPGPAIFHDGMKGWSCCEKRVSSFDDFLHIMGCTRGPHSSEVRGKPDIAVTAPGAKLRAAGLDTGTTPLADRSEAARVPAAAPKKEGPDPLEVPDAPDAPIADGAPCLHRGCVYRYVGQLCRSATCFYHPGYPVFHEGLKGWTCCKKRVDDFDKFLEIEGCERGRHKFVAPPKSGSELVKCRHDYYQTPSTVTATLYAKKVNAEESSVLIAEESLSVDLLLPNNQRFQRTYRLFMPVDVCTSNYSIYGTKVEITLAKRSPGVSWPSLERE